MDNIPKASKHEERETASRGADAEKKPFESIDPKLEGHSC